MTRGGGTTAKYRAALMEEQKKELTITIELNATEYNNLIFAIGFAAGAAMVRGDTEISEGFRRMFDTIARKLYRP